MSRRERSFDGSSPVAASAPADYITTVLTLTPAQIKAMDTLSTDSITIVPAPGAGNLTEVIWVSCNLQFIAPAYATGTGDLIICIDTGGLANGIWGNSGIIFGTGGLKAAASQFCDTDPILSPVSPVQISNLVNKAIQINMNGPGTLYTAGNSPIVVTLRSRTVAVS